MSDLQSQMNQSVQDFVVQITDIARRAALDTLGAVFVSRPGGMSATAMKPIVADHAPAGRSNGGRGAKRAPEDIEALAKKFATFVKANPGLRIEQINKELGTTTKDLALPIRKLIAEGVISAKGKKRSTTYFPGRKSRK